MPYTEHEYLAHYGVKGMRRGIRTGPRANYQIGMATMMDPDEERRRAATSKRSVSGINGARMGGYGGTQSQANRYGVKNKLWRGKDKSPRERKRVRFR